MLGKNQMHANEFESFLKRSVLNKAMEHFFAGKRNGDAQRKAGGGICLLSLLGRGHGAGSGVTNETN